MTFKLVRKSSRKGDKVGRALSRIVYIPKQDYNMLTRTGGESSIESQRGRRRPRPVCTSGKDSKMAWHCCPHCEALSSLSTVRKRLMCTRD